MEHAALPQSMLLLAITACTDAGDEERRLDRVVNDAADASLIADARLEDHSGGERIMDAPVRDHSADSDSSSAWSTTLTCPGTVDAGPGCTPDVWPLAVTPDDAWGNCTATLPSGIDTSTLSIENSFAARPDWGRAVLRRLDAPCADLLAGWYLVDESTVQICGVCSATVETDYWAVVGCADSLDGAAADACVPEVVSLPMRLENGVCLLELVPEADWCVPLGSTIPFGFLGSNSFRIGVPYVPWLSCDDPSNAGWQPVNETTLRLCAGACVQPPLYEGWHFDVTLECGARD